MKSDGCIASFSNLFFLKAKQISQDIIRKLQTSIMLIPNFLHWPKFNLSTPDHDTPPLQCTSSEHCGGKTSLTWWFQVSAGILKVRFMYCINKIRCSCFSEKINKQRNSWRAMYMSLCACYEWLLTWKGNHQRWMVIKYNLLNF